MLRRIEKKGKSGAVLVEFALAFPILLITFIFAIQLLFVFIYDILGSYAAFAAARSYSVFSQVEDVDAPELAKGVATAIMSSWTIPVGEDVDASDPIPNGVTHFLSAMSGVGMGSSDYLTHRYRVAAHRMSDFTIEQIAVPEVYLKEGFEYKKAETINRQIGGLFGSFIHSIRNWFNAHVGWLSPITNWLADLFSPKRYQAQIGEVSFSYDYSQSMVFSRFSYLGIPALSGDGVTAFKIHQRCAMPIEPTWKTDVAESDALEGVNHAVNYQQLLRDNNDVIIVKLHDVYSFLKEEMGSIAGLDPSYDTYSFEEFIENSSSTAPGRLYRDRSNVGTWSVDNIGGNAIWTSHNGASHSEQVDWLYAAASKSAVKDPLLVVENMIARPNGDELDGEPDYDSRQTINALASLTADNEYRERVIKNIDREIEKAWAELKSLKTIVGLEKAVCQALGIIRWLEDDIRDGGGWKDDGRWWSSSEWSRSKPPSDLQADRKSVKKKVSYTVSNSDGSTSTRTKYVHDYYKYKRKIKDDAAIAKAIQDQWNLIAKLNQDIASERQNINYFLEPEEKDVIDENNTEDNSKWYDDEQFDANARINAIVDVWSQRKGTIAADNGVLSGELQRIEENDLVCERFVELMNSALVPIADYYRIQRRMLEDQQRGLDAAKAFSEALHDD